MEKEKPLLKTWKEYETKLIQKNASKNQLEQLKFAYYFGAYTLYFEQMAILETSSSDTTDNDLAFMQNVHNELTEFMDATLG